MILTVLVTGPECDVIHAHPGQDTILGSDCSDRQCMHARIQLDKEASPGAIVELANILYDFLPVSLQRK